LGGVGAVIGLNVAASLVPEILFFVSLTFLYVLTNAVAESLGERSAFALGIPGPIDMGHLAILLLGFNRVFFKYTSLPFTEALGFTLAFAALLALVRASQEDYLLWPILSGTLAGMAYLTRSQFLGMALAIPACLLLVGLRHKGFSKKGLIACLTGVGVTLPWIIFLLWSFGPFPPKALLDFAAFREQSQLSPYIWTVQTNSLWEFLKDKGNGFWIAFDFQNNLSYVRSFGMAVYLVPIALLYICLRPKHWKLMVRNAMSLKYVGMMGLLIGGVACIAPVHALHMNRIGPWFFNFRHGLPLIFLIVASMVFLNSRKSLVIRIGTIFLICWSLGFSALDLREDFWWEYGAPTIAQTELAKWIDQQDPSPVFLTNHAWTLGAVTRGRFHQVSCNEQTTQMLVYFHSLQITHLITNDSDLKCQFYNAFKDSLILVKEFGEEPHQLTVWRREKRN
jgi:hypothetical protein